MCTGFCNHLPQELWVLKHRTRFQMVLIEWLTIVICHEQRTAKDIQQSDIMDISIRVMNKHTWLYITLGIDM